MIEWLATVFDAIQTNPVVAGLFGTTFIAGFVAYFKNIPEKIYNLIYNYFTVTINVYEAEDRRLYYIIDTHLSTKKLYTLNKNYGIIRKTQQDWFSGTSSISPAALFESTVTCDNDFVLYQDRMCDMANYMYNGGTLEKDESAKRIKFCNNNNHLRLISNVGNSYYCKFGQFLCKVTKRVDESNKIIKTGIYKIVFFTRDVNAIHQMLSNLVANYEADEGKYKQYIYFRESNHWRGITKDKIDHDLFLLTKQTESIYRKVAYFLNNEQSYRERSKVYREGFLLYGIPGCGKTHFIQQLANDFDLNLYVINLNEFNSDRSFIAAMLDIEYPSIVVFEDVDAMNTKINRGVTQNSAVQFQKNYNDNNAVYDPTEGVEACEDTDFYVGNSGVSISAILNVFDGIYSQEGQLIFATTNYKDQLDPAFIRAGRFNTKVEFSYMTRYEICLKLKTYYKGETSEVKLNDNIQITIADLMKCCIDNKKLEDCIKEINNNFTKGE
jgi:hypothetical protein